MGMIRELYDKVMEFVGNYASKDIGNVVGNIPDFGDFSIEDRGDDLRVARIGELEGVVRKYESDLAVSRREADGLRNLAQYLKVQNRDANLRRVAVERRVGAFDRFMRDRICDLIDRGVHPLNGESKGSYAFVDRHGKIISMSSEARKVLGYDDSRLVDYHQLVSVKERLELAEVRADATIDELSLRMAEGEHISVRDVHVSPLIVGDVYAGTIVDFRGLNLLERARTAWFESRARILIDDVRARFNEKGIDLGASEKV